jgi:penicillin-binding protein 2
MMILILVILILRLYFLQVMSGELYSELAAESIAREKTIAAPRGNIYDRNGKLLVKSVPVKSVAVQPYIVSKNERAMEILSDCLDIPYSTIKEKMEESDVSYIERVVLKQDIDVATVIFLEENSDKLPGVEVIDIYLRQYSYGSLASHILGYIREISEEKLSSGEYDYNYEGGDQIGWGGLEETYENVLRGSKGKIVYEVDPMEIPVSILEEIEPIRGSDLYLTIDIELQKVAEEALYKSIMDVRQVKIKGTDEYYNAPGGAVVVLSPENGQILAMASYPTYDPGLFAGGISEEDWLNLNDPENYYPFLNRAVISFPPGSVFKIVTAYAGLGEDVITEETRFNCAGVWYGLGDNYPKYCWAEYGHGNLNIIGGIKNSCDVYFYQVGYGLYKKLGNSEELLQKYAKIFGFGSKTGVELPDEEEGLVPDTEWKKEYFKNQTGKSVWFPGDTVNMAIGQGDLLVTPLQMAQAFSILAEYGIKYEPHLVKEIKDNEEVLSAENLSEEYQDLQLNKNYISAIEDGLMEVVKPGGTAYGVFSDFPVKDIPIAAKTGTAEFYGRQDYAWFASYAPAGSPKYVIVAMIEEAGSGGSNVAPIAENIYRYLFNID